MVVRGLINQKRAETTIVNAINFNAVASNVIDCPRVIIESPCILEATRIDEPRELEAEVVDDPRFLAAVFIDVPRPFLDSASSLIEEAKSLSGFISDVVRVTVTEKQQTFLNRVIAF